MGRASFFVFRFNAQSAILNFMRFTPIVSILMTCLTLNAQTIQGKVVRVSDGDTITILERARAKWVGLWIDANPIPPWEFRKR